MRIFVCQTIRPNSHSALVQHLMCLLNRKIILSNEPKGKISIESLSPIMYSKMRFQPMVNARNFSMKERGRERQRQLIKVLLFSQHFANLCATYFCVKLTSNVRIGCYFIEQRKRWKKSDFISIDLISMH